MRILRYLPTQFPPPETPSAPTPHWAEHQIRRRERWEQSPRATLDFVLRHTLPQWRQQPAPATRRPHE